MEKSNVTRIIIEYLNKKGLEDVSHLLQKESKITNECESFSKIKNALINKSYDEAIKEIELKFEIKERKLAIPFIRINQIFNCILDNFSEITKKSELPNKEALTLIRQIISNSPQTWNLKNTLGNLACLLFIRDKEILVEKMRKMCPIAYSKEYLLEYLSNILCHFNKSIIGKNQSKNIMSIINKVYNKQIFECLFHNVDDSQVKYSFFKDHQCSSNKVPFKLLLSIDEHNEEICNVAITNDNEFLAIVLKSNIIVIYKIIYKTKLKKNLNFKCKKIHSSEKGHNQISKEFAVKSKNYMKNHFERDIIDAKGITINNSFHNNIELKSDKYLSEHQTTKQSYQINDPSGDKDHSLNSLVEENEIFKRNFNDSNVVSNSNNNNNKSTYNNNNPICSMYNFKEVKRYSRKVKKDNNNNNNNKDKNKNSKEEYEENPFVFNRNDANSISSMSQSPLSDVFKNVNQDRDNLLNSNNNSSQKNALFNHTYPLINNTSASQFDMKIRKKLSFEDEMLKHEHQEYLNKKYNNLQIYQVCKIGAHKDQITSLSFSNDSSKILTSSKDKTIKIHEIKTGKLILNISDSTSMITSAQYFNKETQIISTSLDSKINVYDLNGAKLDSISSLNISEMLVCEKFGQIILSAPILRAVLIYDIETKSEKTKILINDTIINIALSKLDNGENLLINSSNLTPVISLYSMKTQELIRKFFGHRQERLTTKCSFGGYKEKFIICGSDNKEIFIWNRNKSLPIKVIKIHSAPVNAIAWPNNYKSDFMFSVSDDHTLKVIGNENVKNCEYNQGKFYDDTLEAEQSKKKNLNSINIEEEKSILNRYNTNYFF